MEKTENSRKKLRKNSKTQGKNSRFRQIHLVELPKTDPISKPGLITVNQKVMIQTKLHTLQPRL